MISGSPGVRLILQPYFIGVFGNHYGEIRVIFQNKQAFETICQQCHIQSCAKRTSKVRVLRECVDEKVRSSQNFLAL